MPPRTSPDNEAYAGRSFRDSNRIYRLPGDQAEIERLSLQHQLLRGILGSLFPCTMDEVHAVLPQPSPPENRRPVVLDIGSGSGLWCMQLAMEFPHVDVIGVDIQQSRPPHIPDNCTFETGDINECLSRYFDVCDLVHCRCMTGAVRNYSVLLRDLCRCLRPGGLIIAGEGDLRIYNEDKRIVPMREDNDDDPTHSYLARLLFEVLQLNKRRSATSIGWQLDQLLEDDGGFERVQYRQCFAPLGWAGDGSIAQGEIVGRLMKKNAYDFVRAWRPLLLMNNFPVEKVDNWIVQIDEELHNPTVLRQYNKWYYAWATKRRDVYR